MKKRTATKWTIDSTHSEIGFKVRHMMLTNISGNFEKHEATITTEDDNFENAVIEFSAEINSINTRNADRDNHLKNADFFDTENYPKLTFKGTSFTKINNESFELDGDLEILGVKKLVKLPVKFSGIRNDPWGNTRAGITILEKINRKDWGLSWNSAIDGGGVIISDEVELNIELQLIKQ
jgi:polyisoprenoid-binding protein YceI